MKIAFQGWFLPQPYTGIGQHCIGLLRAIAKQKSRPQITVAVPKRISIKGIPPKWFHVIRPKWWILIPGLKKWYWERIQVPAYFAKLNPDWEHYPYPCPLPKHSPNLRSMTIHDLILWHDKRYRGNRIKSHYHKQSRRALVHADHIFTVSQATHDELGIPAATLLPNSIAKIPSDLKRLNYKNTLVYIGGYDIRKKVPELVKAFQYAHKKDPSLRLILVGKPNHKSRYYPEIPETKGVHALGHLTDKRLYSTLKSALAFVHFSDSEGFNIPLLQAMAAGTPAIVKNIPVNKEVSQNSALFLSSKKSSLSDKVKLLQNKKKHAAVVKKQKAAAKKYSWKKSAQIFLKTLKHGA